MPLKGAMPLMPPPRLTGPRGGVALLVVASCIDYNPDRVEDPPVVSEDSACQDSGFGLPQVGFADPCDGLDNDEDGLVDEGWPDVVGDGVADCVDWDCELEALTSETTAEPSACV